MKSIVDLIQTLHKILETPNPEKSEFVKSFQNEVWNDETVDVTTCLDEILSELAYDLDFYEPDEEWRKESPNYYGDKRLEELIKLKIQQIEECARASQ